MIEALLIAYLLLMAGLVWTVIVRIRKTKITRWRKNNVLQFRPKNKP